MHTSSENSSRWHSAAATKGHVMLFSIFCLILAPLTNSFSISQRTALNTLMSKRPSTGNPCPDPEKPFPCKASLTCIPMAYLCDKNRDCDDGYDENPDVCTAAIRPPVEDIQQFLESEKDWMSDIFSGHDLKKVAHSLAVSPTVDDFNKRVGLSPEQLGRLRTVVDAVQNGRQDVLEAFGMPSSSWKDVLFMFAKLIKSGFVD